MAPYVVAALAAILFAQAVVKLRRRGRADLAGWDRVALFAAGLAVTLVALVGPFDRIADNQLLSAHMAQHVLIGDLAPALMMVALRGPLLVFFLPAPIVAPISRLLHRLQPRVAFALWAANLAIWHVPYLYDLALRHQTLHDFEHLCWVVFGLLVWGLLVDRRLTVGRRLALATAMFAAGQVLTDVLVFSFHSFYPAYHDVRDQQWAGLVMMGEQLLTLGTLAIVLLRPRLRSMRLAHA
ncbi:MAG TPA: cytochrome c oxidase assembly protein [Gaiellaceae bacterium]|nr:cytochrome c oxidase assembly protein [Gaiellaceae bacterium]